MHRSGATPRQNETKLSGLIQHITARWNSFSLTKSTPSITAPRLSEVALRGMRLQQQPFAPPVGNQNYYSDPMIAGLLAALEDSILQSDNLIVLSGETNGGKTCSIAQLMYNLYESSQFFIARSSASQTAEQIIRGVLSNFRSTTPTHVDDCLEHLSNYLVDSEQTVATQLLVVEDVDLLERRELQLLLNHLDYLNESLNNTLKIVFTSATAAEQLLGGLHSDQINQGRVEEFRQPLLDDDHVLEYIDSRLLMGGSDRETPLSERATRLIIETTGGLPGEIDQAATDALNSHFKNRQFSALISPAHWFAATRKYTKWLVFGATLLLSGLAMAFFSNAAVDRDGTTVREISIPAVTDAEPPELQLVAPAVEPTPADVIAQKPAELPKSTPAPKIETPLPVSTSATPVDSPVTPAVKSVAKPVVKQQETPALVKVIPKPTVASTPAAPAKPVIKTEAPVPTATTSSSTDFIGGVISGHQWILKRDPNRFTAQLSAGWSERDLRLFATQNGMTNKTAIYRTVRDGKNWFSLIHGDFETPGAANRAVAKLPKVWRKNSPWIRGFASIQKAIQ